MNIEQVYAWVMGYVQANPLVAAAVACVLVILAWLRPRTMARLGGLLLFLVVVFYVLSLFTASLESGKQYKERMGSKSRQAVEEAQ